MDETNLIGIEMAREEDMLLAGLRRYLGVAQLDDPSEAELVQSVPGQSAHTGRACHQAYGTYFLPAFKEMQDDIVGGMQRLAQWHAPALFLTPEHLCLLTFKAMMPTAYPTCGTKACR